jgi:hypothetical protein
MDTAAAARRLLAWPVFCACSETPIDAITTADVSAAGAAALDCAQTLDTALPGVVTIATRESGQCLAQGASTTVANEPAFEVILAECAASLPQRWRLIDAGLGSFELRNLASDDNLDIQFAATTDGTPAVLFEPHQLYNQRFLFGPRADGSVSLSPRHATLMCLQQVGGRVQIWSCDGAEPAQGFLLSSCEP